MNTSIPVISTGRPTEHLRTVARIVPAQSVSDGAGVRLLRSLGSRALSELDPFLLFDEFRSDEPSDYMAGFPDHPHRGFETVTYMLAGRMRHTDNKGHSGALEAGGVQWMTAGRGIVHSEMPEQEQGLLWGFQLWTNLPARDKLCEPRYQEFAPGEIPEVQLDGARVRVIAGTVAGVEGAVQGIATAPLYLEVQLQAGATCRLPVPAGHQAFCYVFEGEAEVGEDRVSRGQLAVLSDGDSVYLRAGDTAARVLLVAARPLNEPVVRYGPFVMNTEQEIQDAFRDFRAGRF
ncbi:MAG: pirin family protein [Gemmatimonadaceae bacterium]|nr:pirin family protein [Gloeobacterales cyanobacterium ES-bin-141]